MVNSSHFSYAEINISVFVNFGMWRPLRVKYDLVSSFPNSSKTNRYQKQINDLICIHLCPHKNHPNGKLQTETEYKKNKTTEAAKCETKSIGHRNAARWKSILFSFVSLLAFNQNQTRLRNESRVFKIIDEVEMLSKDERWELCSMKCY